MHTYGITLDEITKNNRFAVDLFKQRVIDVTPIGERINPNTLSRLAIKIGIKDKQTELTKKIRFSFNMSHKQLKRRRGDGCYEYEKVED